MSRFYVGQRVKKVRGKNDHGATGVVVEIGRWTHDQEGLSVGTPCDLRIRNDRGWMNAKGNIRPAEIIAYARSEHWEPITDPGRELVPWSACLWRPEGVGA